MKAQAKVKLRSKLNFDRVHPDKVKLCPDAEDWKRITDFVGIKFNDAEKKMLWPLVKEMFINPDGSKKTSRPNLGTFIKKKIFAGKS
jgi:hypothetical protein